VNGQGTCRSPRYISFFFRIWLLKSISVERRDNSPVRPLLTGRLTKSSCYVQPISFDEVWGTRQVAYVFFASRPSLTQARAAIQV